MAKWDDAVPKPNCSLMLIVAVAYLPIALIKASAHAIRTRRESC